ncbi:resistance-nodulation-division (RND) family transporter [Nitzschia inconspicua]|uniref:Resistance-nodulation-division (RND) family transporter n=1 Tax=Nitzschia inconspicua TaxID=303405 RepID=A0A9K3KUR2_9STRA|nr:resistance-nodulation-division (RND) family transporter [Nitzschia inconspicua]
MKSKTDSSGSSEGSVDATTSDKTNEDAASRTSSTSPEPQPEKKKRKRKKNKNKKKKKKSDHSSPSSIREMNLLRLYLQEYKNRVYDHHKLTVETSNTTSHQPSFMDSDEPILIFGSELPRFDASILEEAFLALPSTLDSRSRRQVHSLCDELGLFHVGVENPISSGDRYLALSVFRDGLRHVPGIETNAMSQKKLETLQPWIKRDNVQREQVTNLRTELIYELIDQPGKCLRDEIDQVDLIGMADESLSNTTPPKAQDSNWKWIESKESLKQCILDLEANKPSELAFDLECLCKSKIQQITCLIQLATDDGREYIIDVLADGVWDGVRGLAPIFADKRIVKVGHGVDGVDVPSLHRDFGIFIVNLFDTIEAARVLNIKDKGLASLCARYGLPNCETYNTLKETYQKADWTQRPLTEPMLLYGRYDVHYLLQLRKLMMRDLVKLSHHATNPQGSETDALRDLIRAFHEEDEIDDGEESCVNLDNVPIDNDDQGHEKEACSGIALTSCQAKDLRMNLDLMQVISSSQDKCLSIWNDRPENHWKNATYLDVIKKNTMGGKEWSPAQRHLYDQLAEWREAVASKFRILPGFVCETDFLVKIVQNRPTSKFGVQQISYFLSLPLEEHLDEMLQLVRKSRDEDRLSPEVAFPSFEACRINKDSKQSQDANNGRHTWLYSMALLAAVSATAVLVKMRRRVLCSNVSPATQRKSITDLVVTKRYGLVLFLSVFSMGLTSGLVPNLKLEQEKEIPRRTFGGSAFHTAFLGSVSAVPSPARAASGYGSLAEKLSQKDPALLTNSVFNLPPPAQVYPQFMRGTWNVTLKYGGYLFPSTKIPRERLTKDIQIPGFQKCSIASLSDVGKDVVEYTIRIDRETGLEDRNTTLTTSINSHLGYPAVQQVLYNSKVNPNRLSIVFYEYRTTNAERIELFCNGRESELLQRTETNGATGQIFVCSEYIRQVTFGTGSTVGIPRQVGTNYAHFWTWKETPNDPDTLTGNLLTAGYLDPQDALFFEEPSKPVTVYSHVITAKRIDSEE